MGEPEN